MTGVLQGFGVIGVVIVLGYALARVGFADEALQRMLARLVFYVATPALLVSTMLDTDVEAALSVGLPVAAASVVVSVLAYWAVARLLWRQSTSEVVLGSLAASYLNGGYLGIPVAVYVLGNGSYAVPIMMFQLIVMAPIAFVLLDHADSTRQTSLRSIGRSLVTNPVTMACLVGVAVALSGVPVPETVARPVDLVSGMAVPGALLVFGISLHTGPRPLVGGQRGPAAAAAVVKLVVQPAAAWAFGELVLGLEAHALLAVTVMAALPTAQNVYVYAMRYRRAEVLVRDTIFVSTMASAPVIVAIVAVLG